MKWILLLSIVVIFILLIVIVGKREHKSEHKGKENTQIADIKDVVRQEIQKLAQSDPSLGKMYDFLHKKATNAADLGDPNHVPKVGDIGYGNISPFGDGLFETGRMPYNDKTGPYPGKRQNVPVPEGAMRESSEIYNMRFLPLGKYPQKNRNDFDDMQRPPLSTSYYKPYGPNEKRGNLNFIGSVDEFAPFPEVLTEFEKIGILTPVTSTSNNIIMNLYRQPVAPLQDLFIYFVQDKNGFMIKLCQTKFLKDGDTVESITGYENIGPFIAHIYSQNKYIWF